MVSNQPPSLQISQERLVRLALVALSELIPLADKGPIRPSYVIRVALAVAYASSNGNRAPYDNYWKVMQDRFPSQKTEYFQNYLRSNYLNAAFDGILLTLDMEPTIDLKSSIRREWSKEPISPNCEFYEKVKSGLVSIWPNDPKYDHINQ